MDFKTITKKYPLIAELYRKEREALTGYTGPLPDRLAAGRGAKGFRWANSVQGHNFWERILKGPEDYKVEYYKTVKNKGKFSIID